VWMMVAKLNHNINNPLLFFGSKSVDFLSLLIRLSFPSWTFGSQTSETPQLVAWLVCAVGLSEFTPGHTFSPPTRRTQTLRLRRPPASNRGALASSLYLQNQLPMYIFLASLDLVGGSDGVMKTWVGLRWS